jgi:hypothetical protein
MRAAKRCRFGKNATREIKLNLSEGNCKAKHRQFARNSDDARFLSGDSLFLVSSSTFFVLRSISFQMRSYPFMPRAAAAAAQAYFFAALYGLLKFVDESSGLANCNTMPKYGRQCGQSFRLAQSFDDAVVVHLVPFKAGQLVLKRQTG